MRHGGLVSSQRASRPFSQFARLCVEYPVVHCNGDRFGAGGHAESLVDQLEVVFHAVLADGQDAADVLVCEPL